MFLFPYDDLHEVRGLEPEQEAIFIRDAFVDWG